MCNFFSYNNGSPIPYKLLTHPIPFKNAAAKELLPRGFQEHDGLGRRFFNLMRQHFNFTIENVDFYSSSIDRCIASGRAFYNGVSNYCIFFSLTPVIRIILLYQYRLVKIVRSLLNSWTDQC